MAVPSVGLEIPANGPLGGGCWALAAAEGPARHTSGDTARMASALLDDFPPLPCSRQIALKLGQPPAPSHSSHDPSAALKNLVAMAEGELVQSGGIS